MILAEEELIWLNVFISFDHVVMDVSLLCFSVFPTTVHESYTEEEVPPSSPSVEDDDNEPR